ncbi:MAG: hypothetical protein P1V36_02580 [Planctomycetota bacterium]|nr:hypothetical protein [Planctomycetota bacterium]
MKTRFLLPALLLMGAFVFVVTAEDASASSFSPAAGRTGLAFGPRVHVGVGVSAPIGPGYGHRGVHAHHGHRHRPAYREVVEYVGGYYETRTKRVRVHGEQIGWDLHGHALYGPERVEVREYQVWVPRRRVVRRVRSRRAYYSPRVRGRVSVGGSVRVR